VSSPPALATRPETRPAAPGSLRPVLSAIPPEAYANPTWKGLGYFARDLAIYAACVALLVRWSSPLLVVPVWVVAALAVSGLFVVGHDAAHQSLFSRRWLNDVVGRVAMLPSWHVYTAWIFGHNRVHHGFTGRQGYDFVWHPVTPAQYAAMPKAARLRHRVEWSFIGAGAYYTREVWWHKMILWRAPQKSAPSVNRDRALVIGFVTGAAAALTAYGLAHGASVAGVVWLIARVLVVPFLAFTFVIGSIIHVHHIDPDIKWLRGDEWTKFAAQMEGTTVLRAGRVFNFFLHWIMVHTPHHVDMRIPMYNLDKAASAIEREFPGTVVDRPLRFRDFIANSRRCKLYDFDAQRWLSYRDAAA
jgi:omega-6 fatty acid desaturase (delta-12 desaturase)